MAVSSRFYAPFKWMRKIKTNTHTLNGAFPMAIFPSDVFIFRWQKNCHNVNEITLQIQQTGICNQQFYIQWNRCKWNLILSYPLNYIRSTTLINSEKNTLTESKDFWNLWDTPLPSLHDSERVSVAPPLRPPPLWLKFEQMCAQQFQIGIKVIYIHNLQFTNSFSKGVFQFSLQLLSWWIFSLIIQQSLLTRQS